MANISAYLSKAYLDWCFGGAAATQPPARFVGLSDGTPTSVSGSEIATASGYARQTALFGAAASPAGSASNTAAMTFGPFVSAGPVVGIQVWNGSTVGANDMLWYGTLLTARTVASGDTLIVGAGALIVTLS